MQTCTFRFAVPGDEEQILYFIRALADYEHMSDQVVATPDLLKEWIFEKQKAEVLFAEVDGTAVGFALFFHNFSTFLGRAGKMENSWHNVPCMFTPHTFRIIYVE